MNKELPNFDAILEFTDQSVGGGVQREREREIQIRDTPKNPFKSQCLYINNYKIFQTGDT